MTLKLTVIMVCNGNAMVVPSDQRCFSFRGPLILSATGAMHRFP